MGNLIIKNVNKVYPNNVQAIFNLNAEIKDGEFVVIVGPSGCGKSTLLRMIVGLEEITSGEMYLDGVLLNKLAPAERDIAMVFQNYALYHTMSVYNNIGISLKLKHHDPYEIHEGVMNVSESLGLTEYLNRLPTQLSGGQRQRVALGRAIIREPKMYLMDEPLSNLDVKLRVKTRTEIVKLQKRLQTTTIYVTHDQIEAMTMADRIIVMNNGHVMQIGTPYELYYEPQNIFVAGFIGSLPMNMLKVKIEDNKAVYGDFVWKLSKQDSQKLSRYQGKTVIMGIRPENITVASADANNQSQARYRVDHCELLGDVIHVYLVNDFGKLLFTAPSTYDFKIGDEVNVALKMEKAHYFDCESEKRII